VRELGIYERIHQSRIEVLAHRPCRTRALARKMRALGQVVCLLWRLAEGQEDTLSCACGNLAPCAQHEPQTVCFLEKTGTALGTLLRRGPQQVGHGIQVSLEAAASPAPIIGAPTSSWARLKSITQSVRKSRIRCASDGLSNSIVMNSVTPQREQASAKGMSTQPTTRHSLPSVCP